LPRSNFISYTTLFRSKDGFDIQQSCYFYRSYISKGRRYYFIAGLKAKRHHSNLQCIGTVSAGNYMLYTMVSSQICRKIIHHFTRSEEHTSELQSRENL